MPARSLRFERGIPLGAQTVLLIYRILPCIMCTYVFGPNFQEKIFRFNF